MLKNETFLIVKTHIDRMDYYGLLSSGAPPDEFDSESLTICGRFSDGQSAPELANIIADVFNRSFGEHHKGEQFLSVAEAILSDWCRPAR